MLRRTLLATYMDGFAVIIEVREETSSNSKSVSDKTSFSIFSASGQHSGWRDGAADSAEVLLKQLFSYLLGHVLCLCCSCLDASIAIKPVLERFQSVVITSGAPTHSLFSSLTRMMHESFTQTYTLRHAVSHRFVSETSELQPDHPPVPSHVHFSAVSAAALGHSVRHSHGQVDYCSYSKVLMSVWAVGVIR